MNRYFIPADATLDELEKKAADGEEGAAKAEAPQATELREEAKLYREWIAVLNLQTCTRTRRSRIPIAATFLTIRM